MLQVALGQRDVVELYGDDYPTPDGTCIRDYVHVEDLARIHRTAVEAQPLGQFRFYNVGTGVGASVRQIICAAREVSGHAIPLGIGPRRPGDPPALYADASKLTRDLGWNPVYRDVRLTVQTAWRWHQSHPNGYGT